MNANTTSTRLMTAGTIALLVLSSIFPILARAAGTDEEIDYDAIVTDLNTQSRTRSSGATGSAGRSRANFPSPRREGGLDDVLFHGGVGIANMFGTLTFNDGAQTFMNERGVQASLGIDLLSQEWIAEGTARSFSDAEYVRNGISLKEFDLRVVYKPRLAESATARLGAGLAARYLSVDRGSLGRFEFTTPASVASLGLDFGLSQLISVGGELSARNALVADTIDQFTYDAVLRLDAHF